MDITKLHEEILIIIIRKLDMQSQERFCIAYQPIREFICSNPVIRVCNLSMNTVATAKTLRCGFFMDIAEQLRELNMCGVADLYKESLLQAMRHLKRLETLDISYTSLTITDLSDIREMCPTLRNITIEFTFGETSVGLDTLTECQSVFQHFENVHFTNGSSLTLIHKPQVVFYLLEKANLNSFKCTIRDAHVLDFNEYLELKTNLPQLNEFTIYLLLWKESETHGRINTLPVLRMIEFKHYEIIIIVMDIEHKCTERYLYKYTVYATSLFHRFFIESFNINAEYITQDVDLTGDVVMMFWNKLTTEFNDNFFCKVRKHVREYLPYCCSSPEIPAPREFDWFYIIPKERDMMLMSQNSNEGEPAVKKDSSEATSHILNYDTIFKDKSRVQLKLGFVGAIRGAVTLTPDCGYLKKLTYLSLIGRVEYSPEFFSVLFQCCDNLATLNVSSCGDASCFSLIADSISLTHSLKNLRFVHKVISDVAELINDLSECPSLENVHIVGYNKQKKTLCISLRLRNILKKCKNLYSLYIGTSIKFINYYATLNMLNNSKARLNKHYLNVVVDSPNTVYYVPYSPFMDVFNIRSPTIPFSVQCDP